MEANALAEVFSVFGFPLQSSENRKEKQGIVAKLPSLEGSHTL